MFGKVWGALIERLIAAHAVDVPGGGGRVIFDAGLYFGCFEVDVNCTATTDYAAEIADEAR